MRLSYEAVCRALSVTPDPAFAGMEICGAGMDSRKIEPGQLFVCIPGARVDGHAYAGAAITSGAAAVLAERRPDDLPADAPCILVPDSVAALGTLAAFARETTGAFVVGVTGTAGKTTVKEVLAQMLALRGPTAKNPMNLNNNIGLPLSILNAEGTEEFWVLEAGISKPRDMDELGAILRPDLAVILNAGAGHTEGLGAKKTAHYKARLLHWLSPEGRGLVSADYPDLVRECRDMRHSTVFFSADGKQVTYRAAYSGAAGGRGLYRLWLDGLPLDVETPFRGRYGAENTIAIAAAAHMLGLTPEEITRGFAEAHLPAQRFAYRLCGPWLLIDDSYNANPLSCRRMLEAAVETAQGSPLICVMGEMGELGDLAEEEHEALGRALACAQPKVVFWKGGHAEAVRAGLEREHYSGAFIPLCGAEEFAALFANMDLSGGIVLFKGSRSNRLEELVKIFEDREAARAV